MSFSVADPELAVAEAKGVAMSAPAVNARGAGTAHGPSLSALLVAVLIALGSIAALFGAPTVGATPFDTTVGTSGASGDDGASAVLSSRTAKMAIGGAHVVQNNAWNDPTGGQSINVTRTGFSIRTQKGSAPTSGAPVGYPSVYQGWAYGTGSPGSPLPLQLAEVRSAVSSVNFTFPRSGNYDAAYDIWLNPTPITDGVNQQEIMIWFDHVGPMQPYGFVGTSMIDGHNFAVYTGNNGYGSNVVWYVATSPISSWNNMNVLSFIRGAVAIGPVTNSWYLTSIQAGFEVWNDCVGAAVNSFSSTVNGLS